MMPATNPSLSPIDASGDDDVNSDVANGGNNHSYPASNSLSHQISQPPFHTIDLTYLENNNGSGGVKVGDGTATSSSNSSSSTSASSSLHNIAGISTSAAPAPVASSASVSASTIPSAVSFTVPDGDTIFSVSLVLHRHLLTSQQAIDRAEAEAKEMRAQMSVQRAYARTPKLNGQNYNYTSYGSTHSTPHQSYGGNNHYPRSTSSAASSRASVDSPFFNSAHTPSSVTPTASSCLNSPAIGSPYSSLSTPPQMPLDLDAAPHRYDTDVFDIDHYLARTYSVRVPLLARISPLTVYEQKREYHTLNMPTVSQIHRYIKRIFDHAKLNAECVIICLIYLERLMETRSLSLTTRNWIPVVTTSLLTASKVWDDSSSLYNLDLALILPIFTLKDINAMERAFLTMISYELYISQNVYAAYYYGLKKIEQIEQQVQQQQQQAAHAAAATQQPTSYQQYG